MIDSSSTSDYYSRSVLADKLGITLKELTQLMIDAGWILQQDKKWQLTAKGEFEGGIYRQSKKYGEYIAWPATILKHPVLAGVAVALTTISTLAKPINLPARLLNHVFANAGWISAYGKGWQITPLGKAFGGVQCHDEDSGTPYVSWPRSLVEAPAFTQLTTCFTGNEDLQTLGGYSVQSHTHLLIANWLHLMGLTFAYRRYLAVPADREARPDFYLPTHGIVIDYWPLSLEAADLAEQLAKRETYQQYQLNSIELCETDIAGIDSELARKLVHQGVTVY